MMDRIDSPAALRGNQLVSAALLVGQILYAIIIAVVHATGSFDASAGEDASRLFALIGATVGVASIPVAFVLRRVLWAQADGQTDNSVLRAFFTGNITYQAVLEGAGLLNLTFWLITNQLVPFVPVAALVIGFGIFGFPRASRGG